MNTRLTTHWILAMTLLFGGALGAQKIADSAADFTGVQGHPDTGGKGKWYYSAALHPGGGRGKNTTLLAWDPSTQTFGGRIGRSTMAPTGNWQSTFPQAQREWVSGISGPILIRAHLKLVSSTDGVEFALHRRGAATAQEELYSVYVPQQDTKPRDIEIQVFIAPGQSIIASLGPYRSNASDNANVSFTVEPGSWRQVGLQLDNVKNSGLAAEFSCTPRQATIQPGPYTIVISGDQDGRYVLGASLLPTVCLPLPGVTHFLALNPATLVTLITGTTNTPPGTRYRSWTARIPVGVPAFGTPVVLQALADAPGTVGFGATFSRPLVVRQ